MKRSAEIGKIATYNLRLSSRRPQRRARLPPADRPGAGGHRFRSARGRAISCPRSGRSPSIWPSIPTPCSAPIARWRFAACSIPSRAPAPSSPTARSSTPRTSDDRKLGQLAGEFVSRAGAAGFTLKQFIKALRADCEAGIQMPKPKQPVQEENNDSTQASSSISAASASPLSYLRGSSARRPQRLCNMPLLATSLASCSASISSSPSRWSISGKRSRCCASADIAACAGPASFFIIPIVDTLSRYVDQRVRVTTVSAESTLTRDTVPVNVDAIVFWLVWNAEKSILEVEELHPGHQPQRADRAARIHRPP